MKNAVFWDVTSCVLVIVNVVPRSPILFTLMMEAISSFERSVITIATPRHIPDEGILHFYLNLYSSLNVVDNVANRGTTICNIVVCKYFNVYISDRKQEENEFLTEWYQSFMEFNVLLIFTNQILICYCQSQTFEIRGISESSVCCS
jgi:hypothetical protein